MSGGSSASGTTLADGAPAASARRARVAAHLEQTRVDAVLLTHPVNVAYLTGLVSSNAACLITSRGETTLATDSRYAEAVDALDDGLALLTARDVVGALAERAVLAASTLAVEQAHLSMSDGQRLTELLDARATLVDAGPLVEDLRATKEPAEVDAVAEACDVSVAALRQLLAGPFVGRSEREIARDLEARMLLMGADGLAFDTIVASGPHGSVPHHSPTDRPVAAGDMVTIDFGAKVRGYHADCTRTVLVRSGARDWQAEIHAVVRQAQADGVAALSPGASVAMVDAAARDVVTAAGYGEFFVHGLGHGVGLAIHEPPWLASTPQSAGTLPARTTVTVEPGIYLPGTGGVRIEDTTDVGPDGVRVLTDYPTDLLVVDEAG